MPIAGYTTTYSNCANVSVANGGTQTCTITNDDVAGTLIVKKVVINDNGGSMKATDFKFKVDGGSAVAFAQDGGNALAGKNTLSVSAGSHSVVEDALPIAGYTTTYSNCANVSVANGGTQTCTITNDDVAGTLIVKKVVINDNGGTMKATDFKFKAGWWLGCCVRAGWWERAGGEEHVVGVGWFAFGGRGCVADRGVHDDVQQLRERECRQWWHADVHDHER